MSRKSRKKSPKKSGRPAAGQSAGAKSLTASKSGAAKTSRAPAGKSGKNAKKRQPRVPEKAPSKPPKSSRPTAIAAKTLAGKPPARKVSGGKTDTPPARRPALAEGARAPSFRLPRDGGDTVALADFSGQNLVLFFYPRADTPGCTKEAIDFTRLSGAFAQSQTAILGVSADPPKAQEAFRNKHQLSIPLVSDEAHAMLEAYGAWGEKSMYGKTFQGILRTTVLIGTDGKILRIWRNVRVDGHADEVLAAVRAL